MALAEYGLVINEAQQALVRAGDDLKRAKIQTMYAEKSAEKLRQLDKDIGSDPDLVNESIAIALTRHVQLSRNAAFIYMQDCVASLAYETNEDIDMPKLSNYVSLNHGLTQLKRKDVKTNLRIQKIDTVKFSTSDDKSIFPANWREHLLRPQEYGTIKLSPLSPDHPKLRNHWHLRLSEFR